MKLRVVNIYTYKVLPFDTRHLSKLNKDFFDDYQHVWILKVLGPIDRLCE